MLISFRAVPTHVVQSGVNTADNRKISNDQSQHILDMKWQWVQQVNL